MAGITQEVAEAKLQEYLDAETAVLTGQSYSIAGRSLTRANLSEIRAGIDTWDSRVKSLALKASGRGRVVSVSP